VEILHLAQSDGGGHAYKNLDYVHGADDSFPVLDPAHVFMVMY